MSKEDFRKYYFMLLFLLVILIGSIPCLIVGLAFLVESGNLGWIALMVLAVIMLFGSISSSIVIAGKMKSEDGKEVTANARVWLVIAIISFILSIAIFFLIRYLGTLIIYSVLAVFFGVFVFSIIMVFNNRDQFRSKKKLSQ